MCTLTCVPAVIALLHVSVATRQNKQYLSTYCSSCTTASAKILTTVLNSLYVQSLHISVKHLISCN